MTRRPDLTLDELERVYRAEFKALLRTATAYLGDLDAARDAVQTGVANAIRRRHSYRGDGSVEAWLWSVVLNAVRDHYRERAHERMLAADLAAEDLALGERNGDRSVDAVRAAVRRLPERQRLVLFLRFYADMDYATIAALLDISAGTVAASLNAASTTLRSLLKEVQA